MKTNVGLKGYVPPHIQHRLAASGRVSIDIAVRTAEFDGSARTARQADTRDLRGRNPAASASRVEVHDAHHATRPLPGDLVRSSKDDGPCGDVIAEAAYQNIETVRLFFAEVFGRDSIDNSGYALTASVHYGRALNNAFWNGHQMLFGDGDGEVYAPFCKSLEIVGHELSHAMMQATSDLDYENQSGALNESFADVMAAMIVQRDRGQTVDDADWFIGRDVLLPEVGALGLRSFSLDKAFSDHPDLGTDDQPKHMDQYDHTLEDDGGVHINAGIPNHAFHLAAMQLGGRAWERAGRFWFEAFVRLPRNATFEDAAEKTVWTAREHEDHQAEAAFREAWRAVGITVEN